MIEWLDQLTLRIVGIVPWLLFWFLPAAALAFISFVLLSLPLRRRERTANFLDLLETGFELGKKPEAHLAEVSATGDMSLGPRFHLLGAYLESGYTLGRALDQVPSFVGPRVVAILQAGETVGDVSKVIPAARKTLEDGISHWRGMVNYQVVILFVMNPLLLGMLPFMVNKVVPVFMDIFQGFGRMPPLATQVLANTAPYFWLIQVFCTFMVYALFALYLGGSRFANWLERGIYPVSHWISYRISWTRKRLQRDFSAMLAVLLDAEVPEEEALRIASECTANFVFIQKARELQPRLGQGESLLQVIKHFDVTGEFEWRLANACRTQSGFVAALQGWHDSLDAQAFKEEQVDAQTISTALVLVNGAIISLLIAAVMGSIFSLSNVALDLK